MTLEETTNSCCVFAFFVPLIIQHSHIGLQQILRPATSGLKCKYFYSKYFFTGRNQEWVYQKQLSSLKPSSLCRAYGGCVKSWEGELCENEYVLFSIVCARKHWMKLLWKGWKQTRGRGLFHNVWLKYGTSQPWDAVERENLHVFKKFMIKTMRRKSSSSY